MEGSQQQWLWPTVLVLCQVAATQLFIGPVWMADLWDRLKMSEPVYIQTTGGVTNSIGWGGGGTRFLREKEGVLELELGGLKEVCRWFKDLRGNVSALFQRHVGRRGKGGGHSAFSLHPLHPLTAVTAQLSTESGSTLIGVYVWIYKDRR